MRISSTGLATIALLALAACGGATQEQSSNSADDFAARINGGGKTPTRAGTVAPNVAQPREGTAEGAFAPGTATDPDAATCGANKMGPFIGQTADNATRSAVMETVGRSDNVRFLKPGGAFINPDPTSPRLNLMLDATGVIRDARCG